MKAFLALLVGVKFSSFEHLLSVVNSNQLKKDIEIYEK